MSDPKSSEQGKRPAWAKNMDDATWNEFYSSRQNKEQKNDQTDTAHAASNNTSSNIQEEIISASAKSTENKDDFDLESGKNTSTAGGLSLPTQEEIEAAIVKANAPAPSGAPSASSSKEEKSAAAQPEKAEEKKSYRYTAKEQTPGTKPAVELSPPSSRPGGTGNRPGRVAADPERPVRGYGVLTILPLVTLTILLAIHTASFIYTQSGQILLENPQQITVAKTFDFSDQLFIPSIDNQAVKEISPGQYWFLGAVFKLSPFSDTVNLHLAGAIAALLMLWAAYALCKAAIPKNKGVAFSAGLILLSSVIFLGGAWFFTPEILAVALATLAQAMLLKGFKHPSGAYLWLVPAMILGALAILSGGVIIALLLFIPIIFYLVGTANVKRLGSPDFIAGLVFLIIVLAAWVGGATFFLGWDKLAAYILPFTLVQAGDPVVFSTNEMIVYGCVLLLPWLFLPILLLDRIIVKIPGIGESLKNEKGQGTLFIIMALLAALALLAIDRVNHPALGLAVLPPVAILASRAVLYMSRSRVRIFILLTALIFAALTALLALRAGGFGTTLLPWELDLWAIAPLIGAAAFCTLFLARAAQVSAGKALLLVYAICWLFIAQVFLFAGMPASAKHLKFSDIETAIAEKKRDADWTIVYLNTPAWAANYSLTNSKTVDTWQEVENIASSSPTLVVMPEEEWEALDKKQYPFKKVETQILVLTPYVLAQSAQAGQVPVETPPGGAEETTPADQENILLSTNATEEMPAGTADEQLPAEPDTGNATQALQEEQSGEQMDSQNATAPSSTEPAFLPVDTAEASRNATSEDATGKQTATQADDEAAEQAAPADEPAPEPPVEPEKPKPGITQEETVSTTYTPKAMRQIDLVYGKISGMPELTVVVRYKEIKQLN